MLNLLFNRNNATKKSNGTTSKLTSLVKYPTQPLNPAEKYRTLALLTLPLNSSFPAQIKMIVNPIRNWIGISGAIVVEWITSKEKKDVKKAANKPISLFRNSFPK